LWERVQKENLKPILKLVEDRKAKIWLFGFLSWSEVEAEDRRRIESFTPCPYRTTICQIFLPSLSKKTLMNAKEMESNTITTGDIWHSSCKISRKNRSPTRLNQQLFGTSQSVGDFDSNLSCVEEKGAFLSTTTASIQRRLRDPHRPTSSSSREIITSQVLKAGQNDEKREREGRI
jgi:hypothetical protein